MNKKIKILIPLVLIFISLNGFSQVNDFTEVDKHALSVKSTTKIDELTASLVEPFDNDVDKARAIYVWVTNNIRYSVHRMENRPTYSITGSTKAERDESLLEYQKENARLTIRKKNGICHDYSILIKLMCIEAGLESEIIQGYVRTDHSQIGKKVPLDHAWNKVKIDDTWYIIDATWGAGYVKNQRFVQLYSDYYFMINPELIKFSHYAEKKNDLLLDYDFSYEDYINQAVIMGTSETGILNSLISVDTDNGILAKKTDFHFSIEINTEIEKILYYTTPKNIGKEPDYTYENSKLSFTIPAADMKGKYLFIIFDDEVFAIYKIK